MQGSTSLKTSEGGAAQALHLPLFLRSLPVVFVAFGLPIYSKVLGASALEIGGLFSVVTALTLLLRPVVGWALDRYGRKYFFVASLIIYTIAMLLFAVATNITALYLARIVQGASLALLWISVNTIAADTAAPGKLGKTLGQINQVVSRAGLIGVLAGFVIMSIFQEGQTGWQTAFLGYTSLAAIASWLAWRNVPETRPERTRAKKSSFKISGLLLNLLVIVFITGASEAMISPIYLIFLQDRFTTDIMTLAWAFFPAGIVSAFLSARLGALSDRFGRTWMMAAGLLGSGLLSLLLPVVPALFWVVVLYTTSATVWAISEPAEAAFVAEITGEERRGTGFGLHNLAGNLGALFGPLVGGLLYDTIGQAVPFYINGVILVLSAFFVIAFLRDR
jgi:MFS family permease